MPLEVKEWLDAMDITGYELKWHQYERSSVLDSTHSHCIWDTMLVFENPSHAAMFKLAWSTNKQLLNTEGLSGNEFSSSK